jgi:ATP-dependent DNA helicase RecQ
MNIETVLQQKFGYSSFRTGQREIIEDVVARKNVFAMLPTGAGKSICYLLPGYMLKGTVVIVSPLLSLMEDQVQQLKQKGEKRVVALNSFLQMKEKFSVLQRLHTYKFVFVSPEILQKNYVREALQRINVSLFAIDEAHCISQWGHEFRTDYLKLKDVLLELKNPICLALTATATEEVQNDILSLLNIENAQKHIYSVNRPNIAIHVQETSSLEHKIREIISQVKQLEGPGMIYFSSRYWAERMTHLLQAEGLQQTAAYHGGLSTEDRLLIQQQFMNNQIEVVCCTNAFGMGMNKDNIRFVIHFHYPAYLESYLQEIGRAGRDGNKSIAMLFYTKQDHELPFLLMDSELPTENEINTIFSLIKTKLNHSKKDCTSINEIQELIEQAGMNEVKMRFLLYQFEKIGLIREEQFYLSDRLDYVGGIIQSYVKKRLNDKTIKIKNMIQFLTSTQCRRQHILHFFNESKKEFNKNCCDFCGINYNDYKKTEKNEKKHAFLGWKKELKLFFNK